MTAEVVREALARDRTSARRWSWVLRLGSLAFALAYLVTIIVLGRLEMFYLLLTLGTVLCGAAQFVVIERYRVPAFLARLARTPDDRALRTAAEDLWPEVRREKGRELASLGPTLMTAEEIEALTLDEALALVRSADRADWERLAPRLGYVLAAVLVAIVAAVVFVRPSPA